MANHRPLVLAILDGWGYSDNPEGNAITAAATPHWDDLWQRYPRTLISGSGAEVGLPASQMGNSEVGHLNLGAGRVVYQEFTRISLAINNGDFFTNRTLTDAVDLAISNNKAIHVLGLLSPGGVHSHEKHIHAVIQLAAQRSAKNVFLHAFLDGRDTAPKSAAKSITAMQNKFNDLETGRFASIIGRYYSMDRDHRWPRIQAAYNLITDGIGEFSATTAEAGLEAAYARNESDEFVKATAITNSNGEPTRIEDGDVIIFANYRSDRARQITRALTDAVFTGFTRQRTPKLARFVSLTEYSKDFSIPVAYPAERLKNGFGEYIAHKGLRQLRIAETEKYAHVTFFFNGGEEQPFKGEDRTLIPSPDVATYDLQPEMSAKELTDKLIRAIESKKYDVIICNYANPDMVGHTGCFEATVKAIETIDHCLDRVVKAVHHAKGELLITADHGNAEKMYSSETDQAHTAHTSNPVPFIYVGRAAQTTGRGSLADVAPTMLYLLSIDPPVEMNGKPLVKLMTDKE